MALVRGFHGVRGAVRVEVLTDQPAERFAVGAVLHPEGRPDPLTIAEARPAEPGWVLRFREVPTRGAAEALRDLYLERDAPPEALPRGTYYWHELVGVQVTDVDGGRLGVVRDVYRSGGAEILIVTGGPRGDFDVPVARPFVRILAPRRGEVVIDAALLDLPEPGSPPGPRSDRTPRPARGRRARRARRLVVGQPGPAADAAAPGVAASDGGEDDLGAAPVGAEDEPTDEPTAEVPAERADEPPVERGGEPTDPTAPPPD